MISLFWCENDNYQSPLQLASYCTENAIKNSTVELPLPTDNIIDLLKLCLTSTYFQHNGKHYKQFTVNNIPIQDYVHPDDHTQPT